MRSVIRWYSKINTKVSTRRSGSGSVLLFDQSIGYGLVGFHMLVYMTHQSQCFRALVSNFTRNRLSQSVSSRPLIIMSFTYLVLKYSITDLS